MRSSFLRRFTPSRYKNGAFAPEVFECRPGESELSFHLRGPALKSVRALRDYQASFHLPSGDLPGVCKVRAARFAEAGLPTPEIIEP